MNQQNSHFVYSKRHKHGSHCISQVKKDIKVHIYSLSYQHLDKMEKHKHQHMYYLLHRQKNQNNMPHICHLKSQQIKEHHNSDYKFDQYYVQSKFTDTLLHILFKRMCYLQIQKCHHSQDIHSHKLV